MTRDQKILAARQLRVSGWSSPDISRRLGVPASTIRNWCLGRDCVDCHAPIDGSNGKKSERCSPCQHAWEDETRTWTRDTIIAAIQRFARENGRPPLAADWNHAGRGAGYPPTSGIYRSRWHPNAIFASWAEAIEAAGFPRPEVGRYERTAEVRVRIGEGQRRRWARQRAAA